MRKLSALALALVGLVASPALAGFVVTTGTPTDVVNNTDTGTPGASVGDSFHVAAGTFATYTPDGANDPVLGSDLSSYGYTLDANVDSVVGNVVTYSGTYRIFYDLNNNNVYDAASDTSVSFGNASLTATFVTGFTANVLGSLSQLSGPTGPGASSFADLGARYNYNPVTLAGTYAQNLADTTGGTGFISGSLTQSAAAVVPLPTAATGGLALLGGLVIRRNRRA